MTEDFVSVRIPRFTGRKTFVFNLLVLAVCAANAVLLVRDAGPFIGADTGIAVALMASVNIVLRYFTTTPIYGRDMDEPEEITYCDPLPDPVKEDAYVYRPASLFPELDNVLPLTDHAQRNAENAATIQAHLNDFRKRPHLRSVDLPKIEEEHA